MSGGVHWWNLVLLRIMRMITEPGAPFHVSSIPLCPQGRLHREGHCFCCGPSLASGHLCYLAPGGQSGLYPRPTVCTGFPAASVVKNPPANAGDSGSIPGSGRSTGEGNGSPLQYSSLKRPPWREEPGSLQSLGLQKSWT